MITLTSCCVVWLPFSVQIHTILHFHLVVMDFVTPNLPEKKLLKDGNIILGAILPLTSFNKSEQKCDGVLSGLEDIHKAEVRH